MNSPEPRNRVVVFRLSQEEYQALKTACSARGARNLSEFTRSELLGMIQSESLGHMVQKRLTDVELTLTNLHTVLRDLSHRLEGASFVVLNDRRKRGSAGGDAGKAGLQDVRAFPPAQAEAEPQTNGLNGTTRVVV